METYLIGGAVRDKILGRESNDFDYTVVLPFGDYDNAYGFMNGELRAQGFEIFLETPQYFTTRARFPKGHENERIVADFVLARKESGYSDGRRPNSVQVGTLMDDISRRDFRMNAIAEAPDGTIIDPHNGRDDIDRQTIRCVGEPMQRFEEDALRMLRALRFTVTLGFVMSPATRAAIYSHAVLIRSVSEERIREELDKMFRADTLRSLRILESFPVLTDAMFDGKLRLMPTMKG